MNFEAEQMSLYDQDLCSGKMSQEHSAAERKKAKTSSPSSVRSLGLKAAPFHFIDLTPGHGDLLGQARWEVISPSLGGAWMLNTGVAPSVDCVSSLSRILQASAHRKYYLSRSACLGMLRRARVRNKPLPVQLKLALELQAGVRGTLLRRLPEPPLEFHIDQDNLAKNEGGYARTPIDGFGDMKTYTAAFSAGAGSKAGSIAYSEDVAPTLKASQSGNMMPTVICLNDQGGRIMDCSVDVAGTLRAQEHGHQPLVFENHGIDSRYRGPLPVAPTLSARAGTGGNNLPLVSTELFNRLRVDEFQAGDIASTESAQQYKDATDLVYQKTVESFAISDQRETDTQNNAQDQSVIETPLLIRRLTPLECERLQGFPDEWTNIPGASDSARYKALGNSVAVPCVEYLFRRTVEYCGLGG